MPGCLSGLYHPGAGHWTSHPTSLRLGFLICKMGAPGAAAWMEWGDGAEFCGDLVPHSVLLQWLGCGGEETKGPPHPPPGAEQVWAQTGCSFPGIEATAAL